MTPEIIARLKSSLPQVRDRVYGAAALAALMRADAVPTVTPCLHVIPTGILGKRPATATGPYVQSIERGFGVVLSLKSFDPDGALVLDDLSGLIGDVILALSGWSPNPRCVGVMVFQRAILVTFAKGAIITEIDFTLQDQLRI